MSRLQERLPALLLLALLITVVAIFWRGLFGPFLFDDFHAVVENANATPDHLSWQVLKAATAPTDLGPFGRSVAILSFAVNHALLGAAPAGYKLVNVGIHLLSALFVYWLVLQLGRVLQQRGAAPAYERFPVVLALLTATVWALHPLQLTSVLYVVQRMTSLAGLFTFAAMAFYVWGRVAGGWRMVVGCSIAFAGCMPLAVMTKEIAVLIPVLIAVVEFSLFRGWTPSQRSSRFATAAPWLLAGMPAAGFLLFLSVNPSWITDGYPVREFTMSERALTQTRVLWYYLRLFFLPSLSEFSVHHDDFRQSTGWLTPVTTAWAAGGLAALLLCGFAVRRWLPWLSFGILFYLAGHSLESTIFPLELVHEHRNYVPSMGLAFAIAFPLSAAVMREWIFAPAIGALIVCLAALTFMRATIWGNPVELLTLTAHNHPTSPRANYEAGHLFFRAATRSEGEIRVSNTRLAKYYFRQSTLDPEFESGYLALIWLQSSLDDGADGELIGATRRRLAESFLEPQVIRMLQDMNRCRLQGRCEIADELMRDLLLAALGNERIRKRAAAILLNELAFLAIERDGSTGAADLVRQAHELDPGDPQFALNYVELLLTAGERERARNFIREVTSEYGYLTPAQAQTLARQRHAVSF